jgi:hypothetical protein
METRVSSDDWVRRQRKALNLTPQTLADRVGPPLDIPQESEQDVHCPSQEVKEGRSVVLSAAEPVLKITSGGWRPALEEEELSAVQSKRRAMSLEQAIPFASEYPWKI